MCIRDSYRKNGEWFEGGSESMFTPVLKFKLYERFSNEVLEVSESMEKDGRRTFGYDPVSYTHLWVNTNLLSPSDSGIFRVK